MTFQIDNIILWLKNGKSRLLTFLPNKINIITGDSNTGKTAIQHIVDYCLFASRHKISDSKINENVEWYGIKITLDEKCYTIVRRAPSGENVSSEYYFSSTGEIPEKFPEENINERALKITLETQFNIDRNTKVSYGGKTLKADSKISLRFFLLFNTISQDIITHSEEFFDKQKEDRYREALPRTFDIATGIDTTENIIKREKKIEIEQEIRKLEREGERTNRKRDAFYEQLTNTLKTAKEYSLIPEDAEIDDAIDELKDIIANAEVRNEEFISGKFEEINAEINALLRKKNNLERFTKEYKNYKKNLKETGDSLKPIEYITDNFTDIIKTSIFDEVISGLKNDYAKIKKANASRTPLDSNISDIIKGYDKSLQELYDKRELLPEEIKAFENEKNKYIFIGEIKAKLSLFDSEPKEKDNSKENRLDTLNNDLNNLQVESIEKRRALFIKALDETIQDYISKTQKALENYGNWRASFNYEEKKLQLRKPKSDLVENIGSSSNHMFLHLFLYLGLHEQIIKKNIQHVAPFLIIDQISRPYWGDGDLKKKTLDHSDISKVTSALDLLNSFITDINNYGHEFQMIVFEHIPKEHLEGFNNIHLVEEFNDGNALIPEAMLQN